MATAIVGGIFFAGTSMAATTEYRSFIQNYSGKSRLPYFSLVLFLTENQRVNMAIWSAFNSVCQTIFIEFGFLGLSLVSCPH